jgi:ABC-type branched-subunit amino acid transport system substrate-binding protein
MAPTLTAEQRMAAPPGAVFDLFDDGTDPELGALEARRLVRSGCRVVVATTTSATFSRVSAALRPDDVLLVHALMNEGGLWGDLRVQLGERPHQQLAAAAGPMMREASGRRWFLAGNDYVWPRAVHTVARRVVAERNGQVVGEASPGWAPATSPASSRPSSRPGPTWCCPRSSAPTSWRSSGSATRWASATGRARWP